MLYSVDIVDAEVSVGSGVAVMPSGYVTPDQRAARTYARVWNRREAVEPIGAFAVVREFEPVQGWPKEFAGIDAA